MAKRQVVAKQLQIPPISEKRLAVLAEHIKPVVRFARGEMRVYRTHNKPRHTFFVPKSDGRLLQERSGELYFVDLIYLRHSALAWPAEKAAGLRPVAEIRTLHTDLRQRVFQPTVNEVLAQVPRHLVNDVVAFEVLEPAPDSEQNQEALDAGFHIATTILYAQA